MWTVLQNDEENAPGNKIFLRSTIVDELIYNTWRSDDLLGIFLHSRISWRS